MKRHGNLFDKIVERVNLDLAYINARRNKSHQTQVQKVDENKDELLNKLQDSLINNTFTTSEYRTRTIYEPKERLISILPFYPDRIVQHAIVNILSPIWDRLFIDDSYACRVGKGQHKASNRCMEFTTRYEYCLQFDISKFYPSINHTILKQIISNKIKDDRVMFLINDIIDSTGTEIGLPIGNYLSQWFGNLYLNELDMYVKHVLHIGPYIRYCDDFLVFGNGNNKLNELSLYIESFVNNILQLRLSKNNLFHTYQGVDFLGYRHFHNGKILVRKRTAKRIKHRMELIEKHLEQGTENISRARGQVASAYGWIKHTNSYNLQKSIKLNKLKETLS